MDLLMKIKIVFLGDINIILLKLDEHMERYLNITTESGFVSTIKQKDFYDHIFVSHTQCANM